MSSPLRRTPPPWRLLRRAPFTVGYAVLLTAGTQLVRRLDPDLREDALRAVSTNLDNLGRGRVQTLLVCALVPHEPGRAVVLPTALLLATCERLLGARRTAAAFLGGHVGASLLVAGLLAADALPGVMAEPARSAVDTGSSYGTAAVVGAALWAAAAPPTRRALGDGGRRDQLAAAGVLGAAGALGTAAAVPVLTRPSFTDWGHLLALGIGALLGAAWYGGRAIEEALA